MRAGTSAKGVNLTQFEDDTEIDPDPLPEIADHMVLVETDDIGSSSLPAAVRQAIIIEKANQAPTKLIAVRYDCSESTVNKIWRDFCTHSATVRRISDESPDTIRKQLRGKAVVAIESGLDCDRDPYRRAAIGVQVMKGIGEFKESTEGVMVHKLVGSLPDEWKQRYIGSTQTAIEVKATEVKETK